MFRFYVGPGAAPFFGVTTNTVSAAVRVELGGLSVGEGGEHFALFSARFYLTNGFTAAADKPPSLGVRVFDTEEGAETATLASAEFVDNASPSGICHIFLEYPIQNRPTWTSTQTVRTLAQVYGDTTDELTVDLEIEYTRCSATIPGFTPSPFNRFAGLTIQDATASASSSPPTSVTINQRKQTR